MVTTKAVGEEDGYPRRAEWVVTRGSSLLRAVYQ